MGCPVSKRVQTSDVGTNPSSQNGSDENSNGFQSPQRQKPNADYINKPGNNHLTASPPGDINNSTNTAIIKNRSSTRTKSQVEFFAMLDSKIEAGEDLKEEDES